MLQESKCGAVLWLYSAVPVSLVPSLETEKLKLEL